MKSAFATYLNRHNTFPSGTCSFHHIYFPPTARTVDQSYRPYSTRSHLPNCCASMSDVQRERRASRTPIIDSRVFREKEESSDCKERKYTTNNVRQCISSVLKRDHCGITFCEIDNVISTMRNLKSCRL